VNSSKITNGTSESQDLFPERGGADGIHVVICEKNLVPSLDPNIKLLLKNRHHYCDYFQMWFVFNI